MPINFVFKAIFAITATLIFSMGAFAKESCLPLLSEARDGYRYEWQALVDGRFVVSMMVAEAGSLEDHRPGTFLKFLNHALALHRIPIQDLNSRATVKQYANDWAFYFSDIWALFSQISQQRQQTYDFAPVHQRIAALRDSIIQRFDRKNAMTDEFFNGWRNGMIGIVFEVLGSMLFSGDEMMVSKDLRDLGFSAKEEEVDIVIRSGNYYRLIELKAGGPGTRASDKGQRLRAATERVIQKGNLASTRLITLFPLTAPQTQYYQDYFDSVQSVLITLPVQ